MSTQHIGSSFDDFLSEEDMLGDVTAVALKRVIAWQIAEEMKAQQLTKAQLAARMHTSRAALNRLLDENDPGLTLTTLASVAAALGRRVDIRLAPPLQPAKRTVKKAKPVVKKAPSAALAPATQATRQARRRSMRETQSTTTG
jgi:transcriptional regulator with XRE-family HTH domain